MAQRTSLALGTLGLAKTKKPLRRSGGQLCFWLSSFAFEWHCWTVVLCYSTGDWRRRVWSRVVWCLWISNKPSYLRMTQRQCVVDNIHDTPIRSKPIQPAPLGSNRWVSWANIYRSARPSRLSIKFTFAIARSCKPSLRQLFLASESPANQSVGICRAAKAMSRPSPFAIRH